MSNLDPVDLIVDDLASRQGIGEEWDLIDENIQREIRAEWRKIIVDEVEHRSINRLVNDYFVFRGLVFPNTNQAFLFLVSEIGELSDKLVHNQADWVRNHPENKNDDVAGEISDVLMMLTVLADTLNIDPVQAMRDKFERKGFPGG